MRKPSPLRLSTLLSPALPLALAACLGAGPEAPPIDPITDPGLGGAGPENTFEHMFDQRDPFEILKERAEEGTPEIAARLHSCQKLSYDSLGALLRSRGVDTGGQSTAAQLYRSGAQALGAPNYGARTAETTEGTTASDTKLFDVLVQAAPEIVAAMPSLAACQVAAQPTQMFDGAGRCTADGISCLTGAPATPQHVELCNAALTSASTPEIGRTIAVAAILAAAHTCQ